MVKLAKELMAGTWSLPGGKQDIQKIVKMVKRMSNGDTPLPNETRPEDAFYPLLGDDDLFDSFSQQRKYMYKGCAEDAIRKIRELAKAGPKNFVDEKAYENIVELAKKI